ncbi:MAG: ATP-binding protein [bacterium]|nr:ATP-binding protein [bacterium]
MPRLFPSSLTKRVVFQAMILAAVAISAFVYFSLTSASQSLKDEVQQRINQGLETYSLMFYDALEIQSVDTRQIAQANSVQSAIVTLSSHDGFSTLQALPEYDQLKELLEKERSTQGWDTLVAVDPQGRVLASANSELVGQTISLGGFVDNAFSDGEAKSSVEIMSSDELIDESRELADSAKVIRIPTEHHKAGWREGEAETDAMVLTSVFLVSDSSDVEVGAIVSGVMLNNDNTLLDRIVRKGGGIASINLYDARVATTQLLRENGKRALGTLVPEDVVNTVYISQEEYAGRAWDVTGWHLMAYEPIRNYDNEVIGSISRGIEETEATASVTGFRWQLLILGVFTFVVVYIFTGLITRSITTPLKELATNANRISRGSLEIDIQAPNTDDEIGDLTHSFIVMKDKLREYYTKLEDLVAQRTEELQRKVKDLETARHSIEEEKKKSESILQNVGDGVLAIDKKGTFIACNQAACDILDYDISEVFGHTVNEIIDLKYTKLSPEEADRKYFDPIAEAVNTGQVVATGTGEFSVVTKYKKEVPVTITATPLKDSTEGGIHGGVIVIKDVTKEQEIDKMKSEFVSVASHQLRTPLSASKWFLEMLINGDSGKVTKEQSEYLDHIYKSNERMIALVNDLLNVSRIESGTIAIEPIETDLVDMIKSVFFELEHAIQGKKIVKKLEAPEGGLKKIKIDPKLIRQVFQNLFSNAVKYTPEKGTIGIKITNDKKFATFEVYDTGVGIPKKQQAKVFKKFFRADNVITLQTEGTGLGLYVAKSVVDASGGKIWFKSSEGKGTHFFFTLPMAGSQRRQGEKTLI